MDILRFVALFIMTDYERIEKAIRYLCEHAREQPSLDDLARHVHLSPFHFQRMFTAWAGVSPKKFLQYLSVEYAKNLLQQNHSLLQTSLETGLSGSGRLHDLFIKLEGMTPGEYKDGGAGLTISYTDTDTRFGRAFIASTGKGICHVSFIHDRDEGLPSLRARFPNAVMIRAEDRHMEEVKRYLNGGTGRASCTLHVKGTPFQLKVWESLLKIPPGECCTYAGIATDIGHLKAARAVGTAVGSNPVAYLIPCHRVIRASGIIGDYHWGPARKQAMLGWEAARRNDNVDV